MRVKNRSAHRVSYTIPNGANRVFNAGESMEISIEEINQLSYQPGGKALIEKYLQVPREGREALNWDFDVQPEYDYSEEDVKRIMLTGSLDEYLDMLDFAPEGVISLIRNFALTLPLADMNKMEAFKNKFGYDVAAAIKNKKAVEESIEGTPEAAPVRQRRVQPTTSSKYKVIE